MEAATCHTSHGTPENEDRTELNVTSSEHSVAQPACQAAHLLNQSTHRHPLTGLVFALSSVKTWCSWFGPTGLQTSEKLEQGEFRASQPGQWAGVENDATAPRECAQLSNWLSAVHGALCCQEGLGPPELVEVVYITKQPLHIISCNRIIFMLLVGPHILRQVGI